MRKQTERPAVEFILPMHTDAVPRKPKCSCCGDTTPVQAVSFAFVWPEGELSETITDLLCAECTAGAPGRVVIFAVHSVLSRRPITRGVQS